MPILHLDHVQDPAPSLLFGIGHGGKLAHRHAVPDRHRVAAHEALKIGIQQRPLHVNTGDGLGRSST